MLKELKKRKRVLVAMSGGVDSSLAASLLKERRYDVCGVFLNLGQINYRNALAAAKKVAKKIGIPIKIIDLKRQFKKEIINYFLEIYQRGDTPNPCVVCNQKIKFGLLFKLMEKWKFDYLATGHYVRLLKIKNWKLKTAADRSKDQSYFLYNLTQKQLAKLLFPLGNFAKEKTKKMANQRQLPYLKKESQDICFLLSSPSKFLRKNLKSEKGEIITIDGKIIGMHTGLPFYTVGQGVPIGGTGPYYVFAKDLKKNQLLVVRPGDKNSFHKEIILKNVNWINGQPPQSQKILVRTRYRQPLVECHVLGNKCIFKKPQIFMAPGQSAVFYSKNGELLGGGIIL